MENDIEKEIQSIHITNSHPSNKETTKENKIVGEEEKSVDQLELEEVTRIMKNAKDQHASIKDTQALSMKNIDWLSFLFNDNDLKNNFLHRDTIKRILINQGLYYLNVFYLLYIGRQREICTKKSNVALPMINDNKKINNIPTIKSQSSIPPLKIGIIGCGNIGTVLLKKLIVLKDRGSIVCKLYVSTRQADKARENFLYRLDDTIEICFNNELIFSECDVIFLCIQPHQLDHLVKDIKNSLEEKIDRLNKRKTKIYPLIISFLAATPLERLRLFFHESIGIVRTHLDFKQIYSKRIDLSSEDSSSLQTNSIEKINNLWEAKKTLIKESGDHFFQKNHHDMLQKLIGIFLRLFYTVCEKGKNRDSITYTQQNTNLSNSFERKKNAFPIEETPELILKIILGKGAIEEFKNEYDIVFMKFKDSIDTKKALDEMKLKYNKNLNRLINFDD